MWDFLRTKHESYSDMEESMEIVRVIYHHEGDGWWAESPDVERWSAAGGSYEEVLKLAEEGIPFALGYEPKLEHLPAVGEWASANPLPKKVRPTRRAPAVPKPSA
jgi:predicted RNase H-like HicB family nuclease